MASSKGHAGTKYKTLSNIMHLQLRVLVLYAVMILKIRKITAEGGEIRNFQLP